MDEQPALILAFNVGSTTIKYTLFDAGCNFEIVQKGKVDHIGQIHSSMRIHAKNQDDITQELPLSDHRSAILALHQSLSGKPIRAVGHRIVHGGEWYRDPVLITEEVVRHLRDTARFAPLHCLPNILGIELLQEMLPGCPHVAVFDTAVHKTLPPKAYLYAIPLEFYDAYKIRKYGFHGINHSYVAKKAAQILKRPLEELKMITCHLGGGSSITAFDKGKSIDNSMGLSPLEGLCMATRSGDIDPTAVLYLMDKQGLSKDETADLLNKKSGLLGLSGKSDMGEIIASASQGDRLCQTAIDLFVYRIQKYIGAFIAALHGVDVLVFTGGIGENSPYIRELVIHSFSFLGAIVDMKRNEKNEPLFSKTESNVFLMTIPANEEWVIANETYKILNS